MAQHCQEAGEEVSTVDDGKKKSGDAAHDTSDITPCSPMKPMEKGASTAQQEQEEQHKSYLDSTSGCYPSYSSSSSSSTPSLPCSPERIDDTDLIDASRVTHCNDQRGGSTRSGVPNPSRKRRSDEMSACHDHAQVGDTEMTMSMEHSKRVKQSTTGCIQETMTETKIDSFQCTSSASPSHKTEPNQDKTIDQTNIQSSRLEPPATIEVISTPRVAQAHTTNDDSKEQHLEEPKDMGEEQKNDHLSDALKTRYIEDNTSVEVQSTHQQATPIIIMESSNIPTTTTATQPTKQSPTSGVINSLQPINVYEAKRPSSLSFVSSITSGSSKSTHPSPLIVGTTPKNIQFSTSQQAVLCNNSSTTTPSSKKTTKPAMSKSPGKKSSPSKRSYTKEIKSPSTSSKASNKQQHSGRWTKEEHQAFLHGLQIYGREWKKVAQQIPTRNSAQIRSHAQKYFAKLARDEQQQVTAALVLTSAPNDCSEDNENVSSRIMGEAGGGSPTVNLPSTVIERVNKILKDPDGVQREVEDTLSKLRARYEELQRRVEHRKNAARSESRTESGAIDVRQFPSLNQEKDVQKDTANGAIASASTTESSSLHRDGNNAKSLIESGKVTQQALDVGSSMTMQTPYHVNCRSDTVVIPPKDYQTVETITTPSTITGNKHPDQSLASNELIALTVLGGELYQSTNRDKIIVNSSPYNDHHNNITISTANNHDSNKEECANSQSSST